MSELRERYRRLLRCYPRDHRREHEEEMLGVLMDAARPGQARPTVRAAIDLVTGGIRVRVRRAIVAAAALLGAPLATFVLVRWTNDWGPLSDYPLGQAFLLLALSCTAVAAGAVALDRRGRRRRTNGT